MEALFMKDLICTAVRQKKTARFGYEGASIIAEPFCVGVSTDGKEVMKGFQIAGGASGWRLYEIAKMQNFDITKLTFGLTRQGFKAEENMKSVECKVE
jgi:hypothetical protein